MNRAGFVIDGCGEWVEGFGRDERIILPASRYSCAELGLIRDALCESDDSRPWNLCLGADYYAPPDVEAKVRRVAMATLGDTPDGSSDEPWNRDVDADP